MWQPNAPVQLRAYGVRRRSRTTIYTGAPEHSCSLAAARRSISKELRTPHRSASLAEERSCCILGSTCTRVHTRVHARPLRDDGRRGAIAGQDRPPAHHARGRVAVLRRARGGCLRAARRRRGPPRAGAGASPAAASHPGSQAYAPHAEQRVLLTAQPKSLERQLLLTLVPDANAYASRATAALDPQYRHDCRLHPAPRDRWDRALPRRPRLLLVLPPRARGEVLRREEPPRSAAARARRTGPAT